MRHSKVVQKECPECKHGEVMVDIRKLANMLGLRYDPQESALSAEWPDEAPQELVEACITEREAP